MFKWRKASDLQQPYIISLVHSRCMHIICVYKHFASIERIVSYCVHLETYCVQHIVLHHMSNYVVCFEPYCVKRIASNASHHTAPHSHIMRIIFIIQSLTSCAKYHLSAVAIFVPVHCLANGLMIWNSLDCKEWSIHRHMNCILFYLLSPRPSG